MFLKWLPWKYIASRLARTHGFIDPVGVLAKLQSFAQPSEVDAPVELLRAGMVLHARGLINTKVIQQNLDWLWPFWVQRQFDPTDPSFLPRAFNITHINLTHRNWTAVGLPGCEAMPIVDPRGMVTPFFDGWSLDAWILPDTGPPLLPPRAADSETNQRLETDDGLAVITDIRQDTLRLQSRVCVVGDDTPACRIDYAAHADTPAWLAIAVRPFNPEGVSFVSRIHLDSDNTLRVNKQPCVSFSRPAGRHLVSSYEHGDVFLALPDGRQAASAECDVGLCTSAMLFRIERGSADVTVDVDLSADEESKPLLPTGRVTSWPAALRDTCRLDVPDQRFVNLYDAAVRTLILLSPRDPYPGPFTYKRFWFRDAAYLLHAMLCVGLDDRVHAAIQRFNDRQSLSGFYHSQEGEWDSNGQVLWLLQRYVELTGRPLGDDWIKPVRKAIHWIHRKRLPGGKGTLHDGLLPAGFSAEHLGNNDYYYWDDYWSIAGLRAGANLMEHWSQTADVNAAQAEAQQMLAAVDSSLARSRSKRGTDAIPASPYRRMDAGAVGSLAASYPLALLKPDDPRITATADWLLDNCVVDGAFFQEMIHSGLNAYLTLHLAQVFLRAGREDYWPLVQTVADLASPTGQWPEAVHPRTLGGCMGDGQHGWAAADWTLMMRSLFVREEDDTLILGSGLPPHWTQTGRRMLFGPTPTRFGNITVIVEPGDSKATVRWEGRWRRTPRHVTIALPGYATTVEYACDRRSASVPYTGISSKDVQMP